MYIKVAACLNLLTNQFKKKKFIIFFFTYIKMFKNSSAKYYQDNKERIQKTF